MKERTKGTDENGVMGSKEFGGGGLDRDTVCISIACRPRVTRYTSSRGWIVWSERGVYDDDGDEHVHEEKLI